MARPREAPLLQSLRFRWAAAWVPLKVEPAPLLQLLLARARVQFGSRPQPPARAVPSIHLRRLFRPRCHRPVFRELARAQVRLPTRIAASHPPARARVERTSPAAGGHLDRQAEKSPG